MSSWSLVLWRPPPVWGPSTSQSGEPLILNRLLADQLRCERVLPRPLPSSGRPSLPPVDGPEEESSNPVSVQVAIVAAAGQPAANASSTVVGTTPTSHDAADDMAESAHQPQSSRRSPSPGEIPPQVRLGIPKRPATASIDAGKALKRPFKSPTRVALQPAPPPLASSSSQSQPRPPSPSPNPVALPPSLPKRQGPTQAPSSPKSSSSSARSRRLNTPFKPPTPSSSPSTSRSSRNRNPDAQLIATLEQRLRTLKQASKCSEDEHVLGLIRQWRAAGREITDRLYHMIPEPELNAAVPKRGGGGWGWGWDETYGAEVSEEQSRYLRDECEVRNGEILNPEGEAVYDDEMRLEDVLPDQVSRTSTPMRPRFLGFDYGAQETKEPEAWNRGTMLSKLGVDPALLGFNEEEDDWDDVEDL